MLAAVPGDVRGGLCNPPAGRPDDPLPLDIKPPSGWGAEPEAPRGLVIATDSDPIFVPVLRGLVVRLVQLVALPAAADLFRLS